MNNSHFKIITILSFLCLLVQCQSQHGNNSHLPARPDYNDTSQWYITERMAEADVFYVISTETGDYILADGSVCHFADTYNDSTRLPLYGEMLGVDTLISGQLNYYSPYYRQCSLQSFENDSLMAVRYPIASGDVKRAFEHYLKHFNNGRPFVLAGFSQGARIVLELMKEMDDTTFCRMIAAYAIGASITPEMVRANPRIVPAQRANDTGVTICYNSVRDVSCAWIGMNNAFAINPVNWRTDSTHATLMTEPSPLLPVSQQSKDTLSVHLDPATRLLIVKGFTATDYMLPMYGREGNYHTREIWLYRDQLRDNIALRANHFKATR